MSFAEASPDVPGPATQLVTAKSSSTSVADSTEIRTPLTSRRRGVHAAVSSCPAPSSGIPAERAAARVSASPTRP